MTLDEIIKEVTTREAKVIAQEVDKDLIKELKDHFMPEFEKVGELI